MRCTSCAGFVLIQSIDLRGTHQNHSGRDAGSPMTLPRFWDVGALEGEDGEFGTVLSLPALMRRLGMDAVGDGEEEDGYGDGGGSDSDSDSDDG